MAANWKERAEGFVRRHWAGGVGDPDVMAPEIRDVVANIYRATADEPSWQPRATLEWEDDYVLWISGSGRGALLWTPEGCWGFDRETTEDLTPWAVSGIFHVPADMTDGESYHYRTDHPAVRWGNFLLARSAAWRQNHPEWFVEHERARREQEELCLFFNKYFNR